MTPERAEGLKSNQRQWDLIRFCRQELLSEILITEDEFDELAKDHAAVQRLEDYDELRVSLAAKDGDIAGYKADRAECPWCSVDEKPTLARYKAMTAEIRRLQEALADIVSIGVTSLDTHVRIAKRALTPAQPSGITGELPTPVCATCGGKRRIMKTVSMHSDADADYTQLKFLDCPDCATPDASTTQAMPKCETCLDTREVEGPVYGSGQSDVYACPDCATLRQSPKTRRTWLACGE